jgi:hypothetical protein
MPKASVPTLPIRHPTPAWPVSRHTSVVQDYCLCAVTSDYRLRCPPQAQIYAKPLLCLNKVLVILDVSATKLTNTLVHPREAAPFLVNVSRACWKTIRSNCALSWTACLRPEIGAGCNTIALSADIFCRVGPSIASTAGRCFGNCCDDVQPPAALRLYTLKLDALSARSNQFT